MKTINLICLPYAGGNKYCYRKFAQFCPPFINLVTLEYPGRGTRSAEPLESDIKVLAKDLYDQIANKFINGDYIIYGHSMGGLLAFLLTRLILNNKKKSPMHIYISGTSGPSARSRCEEKRYLLNKEDFTKELKRLDGSPDEILNDEELLNYLLPILRSDFQACETYQHESFLPLEIPLTVLTGEQEELDTEDVHLWQNETAYPVTFKTMPGGHFFIFQNSADIMELISRRFRYLAMG